MNILINYSNDEKRYVPTLGGILKQYGHNVQTTPTNLSIKHLGMLRVKASIDAVVCANQETLWQIVHGVDKQKVTLDSFRGSVLQYNPQVLVVNSLTHIRTVKHGKWLLERDIEKLGKLQEPITLPTYTLIDNEKAFQEAYTTLYAALIISIDIETDEHARITCISFTGLMNQEETYSCLIPFHNFGEDHYKTEEEYARAIQWMRILCALPAPKCMFNAAYDASYLLKYRSPPRNLTIDMMGFAHSCWSELPKSLDFVLSLWDPSYIQWKHESAVARKNRDIKTYWYYCVKDSFNTLKALLLCYPNAPHWALANYQRKFKLTYPCLYCAFEGNKVNPEKKKAAAEAALAKLEAARAKLRIMTANPNFNPGSPKQVGHLIYKILGARPIRDTSTNEKVLAAISEQHPILARFIDEILIYRGEVKAYGTYFTFKEINGRLLYNIGPFGTETGRANSSASNFHVGTQSQNIPEYAKDMLEADPGYIILEPDNSKAEARIVARTSGCDALDKALNHPTQDFYKILGTIFFGLPYAEVTDEMRNKVLKRIVHGTNYMMQERTFVENATPAEIRKAMRILKWKGSQKLEDFAKYLLSLYHKPFPEVSRHYVELKNEILRSGILVSVLGYTRYFFGDIITDSSVLRNAVAHEPQNLNVDITNEGMWKCYRYVVLPSNGACRLKAQVHDSLRFQVRIEDQEFYEERIVAMMYNPVIIRGREFVIPVERKKGFTLGTMH